MYISLDLSKTAIFDRFQVGKMRIVLLLCLLAATVQGDDPGVRLQASQKAINYMKDEGMKMLNIVMNEKLTNESIPEVKGEESYFNYWVRNIRVTSYSIPADKATVTLTEPNGIIINAAVQVMVSADYTVQIKTGVINPVQFGSITADAAANGTVGAALISTDGQGQLELKSCDLLVKKMDLKFHGNLINTILNWIDHVFENMVSENVEPLVCKQLEKVVAQANERLMLVPMKKQFETEDFLNNFGVDYSLVGHPVVQGEAASMGIRGRVTFKGHGQDANIPHAVATKSIVKTNKMFCINMDAEAVLGSLVYAIKVSDKAQMHLDYAFFENHGIDVHPYLQCNCSKTCLGYFIPEIKRNCGPGGHVELGVRLSHTPAIDVLPSEFHLNLALDIDVGAKLATDQEIKFFTLQAEAKLTVSHVTIEGGKLKAQTNITDAELSLKNSQIGKVDPLAFKIIWEFALEVVGHRFLQRFGKEGFQLPENEFLNIMKPEMKLGERTISVCFDAKYTGPHEF